MLPLILRYISVVNPSRQLSNLVLIFAVKDKVIHRLLGLQVSKVSHYKKLQYDNLKHADYLSLQESFVETSK